MALDSFKKSAELERELVDGGLEAFEEEAEVVAVDETVVDCKGDVGQPAPVALDVLAPVDARYGIIGVLHARIEDGGGIESGSTGSVDNVWYVTHASEEGSLRGDGS